MYGLRGDRILLESIRDNLKNDSKVFHDLKCGKYQVFFSFDPVVESLHYEAVAKEKTTLPFYLSFDLLPSGEFQMPQKYTDIWKKEEALQFFYFIVSEDQKSFESNPEEIRRRYVLVLPKLEPLLELSPEEAARRCRTRIGFQNVVDQLLSSSCGTAAPARKVSIEPNVDTSSSPWRLTLRIGFERKYVVPSIGELLDAVANDEYLSYGKDLSFSHSLSNFEPKSQAFLSALSRLYLHNDAKDRTMSLYPFSALELFSAFRDGILLIDDENYYVCPENRKADIRIEDGDLRFDPPRKGTYYHNEGKAMIIDRDEKEISFIEFRSPLQQKVYTYIMENPSFQWSQVEDIFQTRLLPVIENGIPVDAASAEKYRKNIFRIYFYIDMNDDSELVTATLYRIGDAQKEKDEMLQDIVCRRKIQKFEDCLAFYHLPEKGTITDQEFILSLLKCDLSKLKACAEVMLSESLKQKNVLHFPKIRIQAQFDIDWLNLSVQDERFSTGDLQKILLAYRKKKKFYRLRDDIILLDSSALDPLAAFDREFSLKEFRNGSLTLPAYHVLSLPEFRESLGIGFDDRITDFLHEIRNFSHSGYAVEAPFESVLRPYQIQAFQWLKTLKKYRMSGILADDMGLGKTLETISFIASLSEPAPILIVAPKSLLYNWKNEFQHWLPSQSVRIVQGTKEERSRLLEQLQEKNKTVFVTSYDSLRNDIGSYRDISFSFIVLDEAQNIKNASALKTAAVKSLTAEMRLVLTGTPIENSLSDLWSLFDFLMPGYLHDYDSFRRFYEKLIITEQNAEMKQKLHARIAPFILRRTKAEVLKDLPPKTVKVYTIDMSPTQRNFYDAYLEKAKRSLRDDKITRIEVLALLTRMRQICVDPSMFIDPYPEISEKLQSAAELIKEGIAAHHKLLIFSSFTSALQHLLSLLEKEQIPTSYIHGGVDAKKRQALADEFNLDDRIKVMLVSLKAGGTGLNLIGGDIVIHLDPWWNLASENQATDRAHRIGQIRPVQVLKLICRDSIEEKVLRLQELKETLVQDLIHETKENIPFLEEDDLRFLLS